MTKHTGVDLSWKQILRGYLPDAMDFFCPEISTLIDWRSPPVFLDQELEQLNADDDCSKHDAVQLVEVKSKEGESKILFLHVAIEASKEFEEMVMMQALRAYDRFEQFPSSLAILCDFDSSWRPNEYSSEVVGTRLAFKFTAFKLLDYRERWEELESSSNLFSVVVMAHLKAEELKDDPQEMKNWNLLLVQRLHEKGYKEEQIKDLLKFVDEINTL
jgi:hypothetical protein